MTVLAEKLNDARRQRFVGRAAELAAFTAALATPDRPAVVFVHGPAGIGKSTLLDMMAERAADLGAAPVRFDARSVPPGPSGIRAATSSTGGDRPMIFLDPYDRHPALDGWVREHLVTTLRDDAVIVIGSRTPPALPWLGDPAWRAATEIIRLGPLPPADVCAYLEAEDLPEDLHHRVAAMSHGHPLALSLLVARCRAGSAPRSWAEAPDLLRLLHGLIVDEPPSPQHRRALEIAAHARTTTQSLLEAVMGADVDTLALFDWLRTLPCIEEGPAGLVPHGLARDVIDADLRWRHEDGYDELHRRLRSHAVERLRAPSGERETRRRIADTIFLARCHPALAGRFAWPDVDATSIRPPDPADRSAVVATTALRHGDEEAELVGYWVKRQPEAFRVFRDGTGELVGFCCALDLQGIGRCDIDGDPGTRAMGKHVQEHGAPEADVLAWRFLVTAAHVTPAEVAPLAVAWRVEMAMARPRPAWELVAVPGDLPDWQPILAYLGFHDTGTGFQTDGSRRAVFGCEWERTPTAEWIALTADRELGAPADAPTLQGRSALSRSEFVDAVRRALRDLHDHDRMVTNPLVRAHVVRSRCDGLPPLNALRLVLELAVDALRATPRDEVLHRVAVATFLEPAGTQERIAETLALPFNTYRRYRDRAVARIADWMWQHEVGNLDDPHVRARGGPHRWRAGSMQPAARPAPASSPPASAAR
ncbi:AAA family ATPase [Actinomycetes bacterium KLBMP 9759]